MLMGVYSFLGSKQKLNGRETFWRIANGQRCALRGLFSLSMRQLFPLLVQKLVIRHS